MHSWNSVTHRSPGLPESVISKAQIVGWNSLRDVVRDVDVDIVAQNLDPAGKARWSALVMLHLPMTNGLPTCIPSMNRWYCHKLALKYDLMRARLTKEDSHNAQCLQAVPELHSTLLGA